MRFAAVVSLLLAVVLPVAASAAEPCSQRQLKARSTAIIKLDPEGHAVRKRFGFYFVGDRELFVLFFKPEDVLALVEKREYARDILEAIRRDLPLDRDTDLFKYALHSRSFDSNFRHFIGELLDEGKVFVDRSALHDPEASPPDVNDKNDPREIKRVYWEIRGADGRSWCDDGLELLWIMDTIYD